MMVPTLTVVFALLTLVLTFLGPILLAVWFVRKYGVPVTTVIAGAVTFTVFQLLIRIPLLPVFFEYFPGLAPQKDQILSLVFYSLFLAFTAALFEEGGRWIVFSRFLRDRGNWENAVAFGIGHGGIEAIALIGITYVFNVIFILLINANVNPFSGQAFYLLENSRQLLISTPSYLFLLAGIERVFAMAAHIAFSLFVVMSIVRKKFRFFCFAFLGHFFLNLPVVITVYPYGIAILYCYLFLFSLLSLHFIRRFRKSFALL